LKERKDRYEKKYIKKQRNKYLRRKARMEDKWDGRSNNKRTRRKVNKIKETN
jgi:hypothetical protein